MTHSSPKLTSTCEITTALRHTDETFVSSDRPLYSKVAQGGEFKSRTPDNEWRTSQKRRLRNRFIGQEGKAILSPDTKFKAADIRVPIYIYNVSKETTASNIVEYIKLKTNVTVSLDKKKMKMKKGYDAYKVFVPRHKLYAFLKDDLWPDGIIFRRFINLKWISNDYEGNNVKNTNNEQRHSINKF
jgi:RNA recognition motif-containing protein